MKIAKQTKILKEVPVTILFREMLLVNKINMRHN
jgi:hypothetical protein